MYFYDTGLVCALLGINNPEQLNTHFLKGELFENMIISEIRKYQFNYSNRNDLYFSRDNSGKEIDCIIEDPPFPKAIEIKSAITIHQDFFKNLNWWKEISDTNNAYLIYGGNDSYDRSGICVLGWKDCVRLFQDQ